MSNNDNAGNNLVDTNDVNNDNKDLINEDNINDIDFQNPVHQFENLQPIKEPDYNKYKKMAVSIILVLFFLIVFYLIISSIIKSNKDKKCTPIEDKVITAAFKYASEGDLLPKNEGESISIDLNTLYSDNRLNQVEASVASDICDGSVKITRYKDDYIKTINLTSCGYCSTDQRYRKWSNETTKEPSGKNMVVDVTAYYNYYTYENYNSAWTNYFKSELINKEVSEKYGVALPIEQKYLPTIPNEAEIIKITKEDKNYYRYRDQKWKFYIDQGGSYTNYFSSEQPKGYGKKDESTAKYTEWSEWSLNYPDTKSYRTIKSSTGYKWYYKVGKEKVYWNGGAYSVEQPSTKYNIRDKEQGGATMYRYMDKTWRWYNGNKRSYSGYYSVAPKSNMKKDPDLVEYTNWTKWNSVSYLTNANSSYRKQETDVYSRYRIEYRMTSYAKLENHLALEEFEKKVGTSLNEFLTKDKTKIDIIYKFKYRKK